MWGAPANNTHTSSILSIATFISAPVHLLGCHVGRLAAKFTLKCQPGSARQFGTASATASATVSHTPTQDIIRCSHQLARLSGPSATPSERADGHPAHPHRLSGVLTAGESDKKKNVWRRKAPCRRGARGFSTADRDASIVPDPVPPPPARSENVLGQRCGYSNSGGGCGSTKNAPRTRSRAAPEWPCSQCRQPGIPTPCPKSASMRGSSRTHRPSAAL